MIRLVITMHLVLIKAYCNYEIFHCIVGSEFTVFNMFKLHVYRMGFHFVLSVVSIIF